MTDTPKTKEDKTLSKSFDSEVAVYEAFKWEIKNIDLSGSTPINDVVYGHNRLLKEAIHAAWLASREAAINEIQTEAGKAMVKSVKDGVFEILVPESWGKHRLEKERALARSAAYAELNEDLKHNDYPKDIAEGIKSFGDSIRKYERSAAVREVFEKLDEIERKEQTSWQRSADIKRLKAEFKVD